MTSTNDLETGMTVVFFDTVTAVLTDWEWGMYNNKTFKRWFGQIEGSVVTVNNQPHMIEVTNWEK